MSKKNASLDALVASAEELTHHPETEAAPVTPITAPATATKSNLKRVPVYLAEPVYEQLRELNFEGRESMSTLLVQGLDLLFREKHCKSIKTLLAESKK